MNLVQNIEKWNGTQRWVVVLGSFVLVSALFFVTLQQMAQPASAFWLFFVPLVLSSALLGFNATVGFTGLAFFLSCLSFMGPHPEPGSWAFFVAALVFNFALWSRWRRNGELEGFRLQKTQDELDLSYNDAQHAHGKVRAAYQANVIKIQRYTALNELARSLAMTFKVQDVVILLIETISKTFMVPGGVYSLLLFDSSVGKALHAVRYSVDTEMEVRLNRQRLDPEEGFNHWVSSQVKPLFVSDATNDFRFQNFSADNQISSIVAAPLVAGTEVLGLIRMESCVPGAFRQDDARLLSNFCDLGTVALEHVALYRQTIELAITDGLTGLYVQRYYKERVRDEVSRALEHKLPLCLMMIDVDKFKSYNDTYGHLVGDKVLKVVAQVLKETVRTVDLVARYGGEEFSVLLLKTPWSGAKTVAERIRQKVEEQEIIANHQSTHVTVSIGVAELDASFKEAEAFIDAADQALYQAKDDGRNCVRLAKTGSHRE